MDGYAPVIAYLGCEGFLVNLELREGKIHSQKGWSNSWKKPFPWFTLASHPLRLRLGAHDSVDNIRIWVTRF